MVAVTPPTHRTAKRTIAVQIAKARRARITAGSPAPGAKLNTKGDAGTVETRERAHDAFPAARIAHCDVPVLATFTRRLMTMNDRDRRLVSRIYAGQSDLPDEHTAIAGAAVARDADSATDLRARHIEKTRATLQAPLRDRLAEGGP